jgi:hypothetical protein
VDVVNSGGSAAHLDFLLGDNTVADQDVCEACDGILVLTVLGDLSLTVSKESNRRT